MAISNEVNITLTLTDKIAAGIKRSQGIYERAVKGMQSVTQRAAASMRKHWDSIKSSLSGMGGLISTVGIGLAAKKLIDVMAELEQGWVEIKKRTGLAGEEFQKLRVNIKDLAKEMAGVTLEKLQDIAAIAGQLGVKGVKNIAEFTRVIGMMSVATDLTATQAAEDMAQIANIMKLPISQMERLGSAINELSNNSTAYARDLTNMTKRMGGAAQLIGITTPQVLALAATLKDLGVESEVAGTAISQVLIKMLQDTDKFAKIAGVELAVFKKTIEDSPIEAVKLLAKGIKDLGTFGAAKALGELGLEGQRVGGVLLKLADGQEKLNEHLGRSSKEWETITSLANEYETSAESLIAQSATLGNAFKILADDASDTLLPALKEIMKWTTKGIHLFNDFGKTIGTGAAKISLALEGYDVSKIGTSVSELDKLNSRIKLLTESNREWREAGRFPALVLKREEKINQLLKQRAQLLNASKAAPVSAPGDQENEIAVKKLIEAEEKKLNEAKEKKLKKSLEAESKTIAARLEGWTQYYFNLMGLHTRAIEEQKKKTKELLDLETRIKEQRQGYIDLMAGLEIKMWGDNTSAAEKYFSEQDRLDSQLAEALTLTGQKKIDALVKFQQASEATAKQVEEDGEVVISLQAATATAMGRVEEAQYAIVAAQDKLREAREKDKKETDAWVSTLDAAMVQAQTMMADYQKQVDALNVKMQSLGMKIDDDPAMAAIKNVQRALNAIPDITTKTILLQTMTAGAGGSAVPDTPTVSTRSISSSDPNASFGSYAPVSSSSQDNRQTIDRSTNIHPGAIIVQGGSNPQETAREVMREIREVEATTAP